ncbi:MAG TPA: IclR family transcriptional regulator [Gemmatimonadales bacterium]|nr:IclR family transcriptional regulator [Gemmatimonadales bacterium]
MKRHSISRSTGASSGAHAVSRALRIARTFSDHRPEWSLAELSRELQLSKPTAFRLLGALADGGLVVRSEPGGSYRLGPAAIELGARAQRANSVVSAARPELEALTRATGETSSVEILAGSEILILDEVRGGHLIGTSPSVGTRWPAHAASTGKVLLAAAQARDPRVLARLAAGTGGRLPAFTGRTVRSPARLAEELRRVARQGYAVANGELEDGYVAVGAPVCRYDGEAVAAISVGGPSTRLTAGRIRELVAPVRAAADRISQRLGWTAGGRPNLP